ncbi:hypothetical protein Moror_10696 [Moniliophthora roreri MCA 2997]|uniref:Uncharacterized protein n=1 Tax=Moniliophthora roreri (strain MCA 2997) TaxID=1381753 RepID=V2XGQ2_MONRO|nr:hypothetical protein Moror_10696 [Moniliophthora roreri MCA 2997]
MNPGKLFLRVALSPEVLSALEGKANLQTLSIEIVKDENGVLVIDKLLKTIVPLSSLSSNLVQLQFSAYNQFIGHVIAFITSFPRLEVLGFFSMEMHYDDGEVDAGPWTKCRLPDSLHTLHLRTGYLTCDIAVIWLPWLASHSPMRNLRYLSILKEHGLLTGRSYPHLNPELKHLYLSFTDDPDSAFDECTCLGTYDLSRFLHLENIAVYLPYCLLEPGERDTPSDLLDCIMEDYKTWFPFDEFIHERKINLCIHQAYNEIIPAPANLDWVMRRAFLMNKSSGLLTLKLLKQRPGSMGSGWNMLKQEEFRDRDVEFK